MIGNLQNKFSTTMGSIAIFLASFLLVLIIFDGFEGKVDKSVIQEVEVAEIDFDYVDFPTSISRPLNTHSQKIDRAEVVKVVDSLLLFFQVSSLEIPLLKVYDTIVFNKQIYLTGYSVLVNAP
ncbi:hypothetical protein [Pararhodonellum marinum]|uniref:hypothetical protein n=1 Tax=Pararhodonellum marinum TaxID=2755358 RepID=UPI00188ED7F0|nr:hypothetical protein [Pararhodonellum marinum]